MKAGIGCAVLLCLMGSMTGAAASGNIAGSIESDPIDSFQGVIGYTQTLIEGEELMFIMDVPYIPAQDTPIVVAQAVTPTSVGTTPQPDFILKECQETEHATTAFSGVDPAGMLATYIGNRDNRLIDMNARAAIKPILLEGTTHGKLIPITSSDGSYHMLRYAPTPNYIGNDRAVFLAEFEGKVYKIVINLVVSLQVNENPLTDEQTPVCPEPTLIKVTQPSSGDSGFGAGYDLASINVNFADLSGGAVGQESGSNITLDNNAAGNGWFIDTTPADNSEFLPTSNPNEREINGVRLD